MLASFGAQPAFGGAGYALHVGVLGVLLELQDFQTTAVSSKQLATKVIHPILKCGHPASCVLMSCILYFQVAVCESSLGMLTSFTTFINIPVIFDFGCPVLDLA